MKKTRNGKYKLYGEKKIHKKEKTLESKLLLYIYDFKIVCMCLEMGAVWKCIKERKGMNGNIQNLLFVFYLKLSFLRTN